MLRAAGGHTLHWGVGSAQKPYAIPAPSPPSPAAQPPPRSFPSPLQPLQLPPLFQPPHCLASRRQRGGTGVSGAVGTGKPQQFSENPRPREPGPSQGREEAGSQSNANATRPWAGHPGFASQPVVGWPLLRSDGRCVAPHTRAAGHRGQREASPSRENGAGAGVAPL